MSAHRRSIWSIAAPAAKQTCRISARRAAERRQARPSVVRPLGLFARRNMGAEVAAVQYGMDSGGAFDTLRRPRGRSGRHTHSESVVIRRTIILAAALAACSAAPLAQANPPPKWPASSTEGAVQIGNGSCCSTARASATRPSSRSTRRPSTWRPRRHHRSGAGDARRQAHAHRDAARHRRQRDSASCSRAAWGQRPREEFSKSIAGTIRSPSCSRPRRSWPPANPSRSTTCPARAPRCSSTARPRSSRSRSPSSSRRC